MLIRYRQDTYEYNIIKCLLYSDVSKRFSRPRLNFKPFQNLKWDPTGLTDSIRELQTLWCDTVYTDFNRTDKDMPYKNTVQPATNITGHIRTGNPKESKKNAKIKN